MSEIELLREQNALLVEQNRFLVAQIRAQQEKQKMMSAMLYQGFKGITAQLEQKFDCGKPK